MSPENPFLVYVRVLGGMVCRQPVPANIVTVMRWGHKDCEGGVWDGVLFWPVRFWVCNRGYPDFLDTGPEKAKDCFLSLSDSYYLILSCGDAPPQPDSRRGWGWGRSRALPQFHPLCHSPTPGHHQQHKPKPSRQPLSYRLVGPEPQHGVSAQLQVGGRSCLQGGEMHPNSALGSPLMPLLCSCRSTMVGLSSGLSPALMSNNPLATIQGACCLMSPHCHQSCPYWASSPLIATPAMSSRPAHCIARLFIPVCVWGRCEGC